MYQGYRDEDVPGQKINITYAMKILYAMSIAYNPIMVAIKASFLWSLQKLRSPRVWIRRSLWVIQCINLAYGIGHLIVTSIPCLPVKKKWYPQIPGRCYDGRKHVIGTISIVLITDVMVLIMPTWIIYDIQMPRLRKLMTIAFLSLGCIVLVIGVLRLRFLMGTFNGSNTSYSLEPSYSSIEAAVALIAASGPTIKWMLSACIPALRTPEQKASSYKPSSGSNAISRSIQRSKVRAGYDSYDELGTRKGDGFKSTDEIQLKDNWGRWRGGDANSDDQRITGSDDGIMKTVYVSQTRSPVRPADVV
ncbi:uncharacterized protein BDR25DRAFT_370590 [Lindgomyces ingoldianus]|uniref:Uncharacterized protein n=1 Tax=Lindgomyces ingoldianus TaxID=673940 RepID=A0ACB6QSV0_9PLEO|nr:uncharacterized protein BDR25DRAFT_370590 [Lindgomyces ingoldianus]KAF2469922.1 hypothetical protein BDR25DRAFT_370590 [Lindgomyces ingoldianus]